MLLSLHGLRRRDLEQLQAVLQHGAGGQAQGKSGGLQGLVAALDPAGSQLKKDPPAKPGDAFEGILHRLRRRHFEQL